MVKGRLGYIMPIMSRSLKELYAKVLTLRACIKL